MVAGASMARLSRACHPTAIDVGSFASGTCKLNTKRKMLVETARWPFDGSFTIARGSRTHVDTIIVTLVQDGATGRAECTPYPRYDESVASVMSQIEDMRDAIEAGIDRTALQERMSAGAARNGLDCSLWDLEAKISGSPAAYAAGIGQIKPVVTAYTISLGAPEKMAKDTASSAHRELLKIKLGADGDQERIPAVREAAPHAKLILDANEGWSADQMEVMMSIAAENGASLIEQPLPAGEDAILANIERMVPVCADESLHTRAHLAQLRNRYDCINIKLDKTGGLTEALELHKAARISGFQIMVGCMAASSLAMAPALLLAQDAEFVDLDGPLLLAEDFQPSLEYPGSLVNPPLPALWG